ncbi:Lrp/AsnC family transcriptional regulator [Phenylobacterium aquaticum]|uniref:Lrp/AsnC family transcriptional regulator n=1 Tax=Phenylobacterium aquaticum TaxID=1763816 RepID=UPI0026F1E9B5|nr:Lrp/AsnC family transcriptional regulator [Phenylobacterium aquaticum]
MTDFELDRLDLKILSILQENNQASAQDLAERVHLSPSAILRRIRGYRASGVISADVSILAPNLTGERISVLLLVQLERHAPPAVSEFRNQLVNSPQVQVCLEISGVYDIACVATFRSMEEFNAFADAHVAGHAAVRRYEASFVKRRAKMSMALPLLP